MFFNCCLLRTCGIAIALTIRSFDPHWGLGVTGLIGDYYITFM